MAMRYLGREGGGWTKLSQTPRDMDIDNERMYWIEKNATNSKYYVYQYDSDVYTDYDSYAERQVGTRSEINPSLTSGTVYGISPVQNKLYKGLAINIYGNRLQANATIIANPREGRNTYTKSLSYDSIGLLPSDTNLNALYWDQGKWYGWGTARSSSLSGGSLTSATPCVMTIGSDWSRIPVDTKVFVSNVRTTATSPTTTNATTNGFNRVWTVANVTGTNPSVVTFNESSSAYEAPASAGLTDALAFAQWPEVALTVTAATTASSAVITVSGDYSDTVDGTVITITGSNPGDWDGDHTVDTNGAVYDEDDDETDIRVTTSSTTFTPYIDSATARFNNAVKINAQESEQYRWSEGAARTDVSVKKKFTTMKATRVQYSISFTDFRQNRLASIGLIFKNLPTHI
jgi:hypothetical protein